MAPKREREDSDVELSSEEESSSQSEWSEEIDTPAPGGCDVPTQDFVCSQNTLDWLIAADQHTRLYALETDKQNIIQVRAKSKVAAIEKEILDLKIQNLARYAELKRLGEEGGFGPTQDEYKAALAELERMRNGSGESSGKGTGKVEGGEGE